MCCACPSTNINFIKMAEDLIDICSVGATMTNPPDCGAEEYGHVVSVILAKAEAALTIAGAVPTVAELEAGIAAADPDTLVVINKLTNGTRSSFNKSEVSGADTVNGLPETVNEQMQIIANVRKFNEQLRTDIASFNLLDSVKFWVITSKGYLFGEEGYLGSFEASPLTNDGFGTQSYIPIVLPWNYERTKTDQTAQDDGYLTLLNP